MPRTSIKKAIIVATWISCLAIPFGFAREAYNQAISGMPLLWAVFVACLGILIFVSLGCVEVMLLALRTLQNVRIPDSESLALQGPVWMYSVNESSSWGRFGLIAITDKNVWFYSDCTKLVLCAAGDAIRSVDSNRIMLGLPSKVKIVTTRESFELRMFSIVFRVLVARSLRALLEKRMSNSPLHD